MEAKVDSHPFDKESAFRKRLKWIDINRLRYDKLTVALEKVALWDKIHIHQVDECHKTKILVFSRNEDGIYDDDGKYSDVKEVRANINNNKFN